MLDMFLKTTEYLERRHWDELPESKRRLVNPELRLGMASTVKEAERAIKDGAKDLNLALIDATRGGRIEMCDWFFNKGAWTVENALIAAAGEGQLEICKWAAEKGATDFDRAIDYARTPEVKEFLVKAWDRSLGRDEEHSTKP